MSGSDIVDAGDIPAPVNGTVVSGVAGEDAPESTEVLEVIPQLGLAPIALWQCPSCKISAQSTDKRLVDRLNKKLPATLKCQCGTNIILKIPLLHTPGFQPRIVPK